jgi:catechol 2,3-dioxygenase-like lactoylglutathione lyase family enzyme
MDADTTPVVLAGIHHLKLPVRDVERSVAWYGRTLGYVRFIEFVEQSTLMGVGMRHPGGGPDLVVRQDPERAQAAAGFDYLTIGVPDQPAIEALAARLDALGEQHAGVHFASIGWNLPELHDPDGHEVRFYTLEQHRTLPNHGETITVNDPRETSEAAEAATAAGASGRGR